jgi:hypothetical protein
MIPLPQRLKPDSKQSLYRSAEALRHPKSSAMAFPQRLKPCLSRQVQTVSLPSRGFGLTDFHSAR